MFSISLEPKCRSTTSLALNLTYNFTFRRYLRAYICNVARFLTKGHVITYLLYQHSIPTFSYAVDKGERYPRSRAVLRAIEVTIPVFTMKFQTGAAGGVNESVDAQKEKSKEKERKRERGRERGGWKCRGWKHRRNERTMLRG